MSRLHLVSIYGVTVRPPPITIPRGVPCPTCGIEFYSLAVLSRHHCRGRSDSSREIRWMLVGAGLMLGSLVFGAIVLSRWL